ncbi:MAG: hypothetical protein ACF8CQ_13885 [Rhodopirellula sp. JB044]|uniref:hypothetical protein n=1 Tax=Rhodopirellula sp. JB044 TaxID=3342844 RepID=UPI003709CC40
MSSTEAIRPASTDAFAKSHEALPLQQARGWEATCSVDSHPVHSHVSQAQLSQETFSSVQQVQSESHCPHGQLTAEAFAALSFEMAFREANKTATPTKTMAATVMEVRNIIEAPFEPKLN